MRPNHMGGDAINEDCGLISDRPRQRPASSRLGMAFVALVAALLAACGPQGAGGPGAPAAPGASGPGQIAASSVRTDEQMQKDREALVTAMGALAPETAGQYGGDFQGASEEPAWELTVAGEYLSFQRANLEPVEGRIRKREVRAQGLLVETDELVVTIRTGACQFESGPALPFNVTVFWNGASFSGCARQTAAGATAGGGGWSVIVPRILPAIDACLRRADAKPARVTIAYPVDGGGDYGVRLIEADNGRSECVVAADGSVIRSFDGLSDRDVFPRERDPLFTRLPTAAPAGRCDENAPLTDAGGAQIGWLTRQKC